MTEHKGIYLPWNLARGDQSCPPTPLSPRQSCTSVKKKSPRRPARRSRSACKTSRSGSPNRPSCSCKCGQSSSSRPSASASSSSSRNRNVQSSCGDPSSCPSPPVCCMILLLLILIIGFYHLLNDSGIEDSSDVENDPNLALSSMGALITTTANGIACTSKARVNDPMVIISGQPVIPGDAFCFQSCGDFMVTLSAPAYVTGVTYEHIPKEAHPEKHIKSAPLLFVMHGLVKSGRGPPAEIFLGNFEYQDNGRPLQTKYFKKVNYERKYSHVKISILGNHGQAFTCLYRIKIHGKVTPPGKACSKQSSHNSLMLPSGR